MASAIGGDINEIAYNHPVYGSGTIFPKANEDSSFDPGGFRATDDVNNVDGGGQMITQINRRLGRIETVVAWDSNEARTLQVLTDLNGHPVEADYTVSHSNGTVWAGKGRPVGDMTGNGNTATFPLILAFSKLKQIA